MRDASSCGDGRVTGLPPPTHPLLPGKGCLCPGWDSSLRASVCAAHKGSATPWEQPAAWGEPRQARARRALPGRPAQAASSATTRRPDSATGLAGGSSPAPRGGCRGPGLLRQPGRSLRAPSCAGRWSGARGTRPPWPGLLHESVPVEVVITPLFGSAVAAAPSHAERQLLPSPVIASETLTHPHPARLQEGAEIPVGARAAAVGMAGHCLHPSLPAPIPPSLPASLHPSPPGCAGGLDVGLVTHSPAASACPDELRG